MKRIISTMLAMMLICASIPKVNAKTVYKVTKMGTYKVTAYSGNTGSTYGASGKTLVPEKMVAASSEFPFGTMLYIKGVGIVTVEDRFDESHEWFTDNEGMVLDIYLDSYTEACEWGLEERSVYLVEVCEA